MTVVVLRGDALARTERVVAHGCNALGYMGKGFALSVRRMHPDCYESYRLQAARPEGLAMGTIHRWDGEGRTILNCITQATVGRSGVHLDYDALRSCMARIERKAAADLAAGKGLFHDWPRVSMPRIGSGHAGGDRDRVEAIVREEIRSIEVAIHDYVAA